MYIILSTLDVAAEDPLNVKGLNYSTIIYK